MESNPRKLLDEFIPEAMGKTICYPGISKKIYLDGKKAAGSTDEGFGWAY